MKTIRYLLLINFILIALHAEATEPIRVALVGTGAGKSADDALSLAEAQLSRVAGVELVERSTVDLVFRELKTAAVLGDQDQRARVGRFLGADFFVWLTMPGGLMEAADAWSGEILIRKRLESRSPEQLAHAICAEVQAFKAKPQPDPNAVAFAQPQSADSDPNAEAMVTYLTSQLKTTGVPVLHRRFINSVINEHLWQEQGLLGGGNVRPLPGARFLVGIRSENEAVNVAVLDMKSGRRIAQRSWPANDPAATGKWLTGIILNPPQVIAPAKPTPTDAIQPEALTPLYEGVLLHNQGRYFEATEYLLRAYDSDHRLLPAIRWLQSSYRHAGFTEISASIESYLQTIKEKRIGWMAINRPKTINGASGIALLGVTIDGRLPCGVNGPLAMVIVDALRNATGKPVFLTSDIAQLRAEYDVLAGLEKVQGTTWHEAPPLLLETGITAHVEPTTGKNWQVRFCTIQQLDPGKIDERVVKLSRNSSQWQAEITAALRKLLAKPADDAVIWEAPRPVITESLEQLQNALATEYRDTTLLKLLFLNPEPLKLFSKFPAARAGTDPLGDVLRNGIEDWLWAHIPKSSAQWPWIDLQYINSRHRKHLDEYIPLLRTFVEKNHSNPAGAVAQFNLLLYDLNDSNIAETQAQIEQLLPILWKLPFVRIGEIQEMNNVLRFAIGQVVPKSERIAPCRWILPPGNFMPDPWLYAPEITCTSAIPPPGDSLRAERCKVDIAFYHFTLCGENIPVPLMKRVIEEHSAQPDIITYIMTGYGFNFFKRKECRPEEIEDFAAIYTQFIDVICELIGRNPAAMGAYDCVLIVDPRWTPAELRVHPAYCEARTKLRLAAVQAIIEDRFRDRDNGGFCLLLLKTVDAVDDLKCDCHLRLRAERSWETDPLTDHFWSDYMSWKSYRRSNQSDRIAQFIKHIPRLRQMGENKPWTLPLFELYGQFIWGLFAEGQYEHARELLEEMVAADYDHEKTKEYAFRAISELRANALYFLALLQQRDGDKPAALRTAQSALDQLGDKDCMLFSSVHSGKRGGSADSSLKFNVTNYIGKLRSNPNLSFKNPLAPALTPD